MSSTSLMRSQVTRPTHLIRTAWAINRPLTLFGLAALVTLGCTVVGIIIDPRAAGAAPGWIKPTKFALSLAIYTTTFLWFLTFVQGYRRVVGVIALLTAVTCGIELGIITLQVARGTYSHFNAITPFDALLFSIMGGAVVILWLMCLILGVLLLLQRLPDPVIAWGLRLGILVALTGMAVGFLMLGPKGDQLQQNAAGHQPMLIGAHTVGAPDGGAGLPFVGWSTTNGDLRVAHFIGMHGMQIIPLLAYLLQFAPLWVSKRHRVILVIISALGYLGLIALLTWQALRGQSVVTPDGATVGVLAVLLVGVTLGVVSVLQAARTSRRALTC